MSFKNILFFFILFAVFLTTSILAIFTAKKIAPFTEGILGRSAQISSSDNAEGHERQSYGLCSNQKNTVNCEAFEGSKSGEPGRRCARPQR